MHFNSDGSCWEYRDAASTVMLDVFAWGLGLIAANIYLAVIGPIVTLWHLFMFHSRRGPKRGNWGMRGERIR